MPRTVANWDNEVQLYLDSLTTPENRFDHKANPYFSVSEDVYDPAVRQRIARSLGIPITNQSFQVPDYKEDHGLFGLGDMGKIGLTMGGLAMGAGALSNYLGGAGGLTSSTYGLNPGYETAVAGTQNTAGGGMELFDPWGVGDTSSYTGDLLNQPLGGGGVNFGTTGTDPYGLGWNPANTGNLSWDNMLNGVSGIGSAAGGATGWLDMLKNGGSLAKMLSGGGKSNPEGYGDFARILGGLGSAGLGAYGADRQADQLRELAREQMAAEQGRYAEQRDINEARYQQQQKLSAEATQRGIQARTDAQGVVAPSQGRYEGSFAPGFTMANDPGFTDALNQSSKATLHGLSMNGNPAGSPNAWAQSLADNYSKMAYPALQNYRIQNAATGYGGPYAGVAAAAPGANIPGASGSVGFGNPNVGSDTRAAAFGSDANVLGVIGKGIANVTNPQESLSDILQRLQGGGGNSVFSYRA